MKRRPDAIYVATESPLGKSALKAANALGIPWPSDSTRTTTNTWLYMGWVGSYFMAMAYLKKFHQRADCKLTPSRDIVERLGNEGFENVYLVRLGVDMD